MSARNAHVILKDPADLRPHPLKKSLPKSAEWQKGGEQFLALLDDIRERGIDHPLLVTAVGYILDGETRWLAAKQLQLTEAPVIVTDAGPATVILSALLLRQHLSKGALAFLAYPLMSQALAEAKSRRLANLRKGQQIPDSALSASSEKMTLETQAEKFGISRRLLCQAKDVHALFEKNPDFRDKMLPRLLRHHIGGEGEKERPVGLGAILAGDAGEQTGGTHECKQLDLFKKHILSEFVRFEYWNALDDRGRSDVMKTVTEQAIQLPPEQIEALADYHGRMAKHLKQLAREGVAAA